jgi:hypothetical protein
VRPSGLCAPARAGEQGRAPVRAAARAQAAEEEARAGGHAPAGVRRAAVPGGGRRSVMAIRAPQGARLPGSGLGSREGMGWQGLPVLAALQNRARPPKFARGRGLGPEGVESTAPD